MSHIKLDISRDESSFVLKDSSGLIKANRRASHYFTMFLKANYVNDSILIIPFGEGEREILLRDIHKSLEKYGLKKVDSKNIEMVLSNYFNEQKSFKAFSKQAKGIWENEIDLELFMKFESALRVNLKNRTLYDKQMLAAFHLAFAHNACNFSVPGAGKTAVVYGAYAYLNNLPKDHQDHVNKLLIIGPLSSFGPWEGEYQECFGEKVSSKRLSGGVLPEERKRHLFSLEHFKKTPELTLMSYQSVQFNLEGLNFYLSKPDNKVMIVLDEAHKIKNVEGGVWASSVLSLAKLPSIRSRVVLTGTPIPNGYEDIYNLYEFIWPNKEIINFNIYQLKDMTENLFDPRVDELIDNISPFFIRIKKSDLDLPPIINHDPVNVPMGEVQREIYDFIEDRYIPYFENEQGVSATALLKKARFIRLLQAASNPNLLKQSLEKYYHEQGLSDELYIDDSAIIEKILRYKELEKVPSKFERIKEIVSELVVKGEKVILWGSFILSIKQLQEYLANNGISSKLLIGEVPVERDDLPENVITREKVIRDFHDPNSSYRVIIANPFAVAESISLHKACHNAIYFERTFNAANFIQSKDRIHRVGLDPNTDTHYHYILSENSIDGTIHRRLNEKEARMLELIESRDIPLISENMNYDIDFDNDIKAIIRDYVKRVAKA